MPSIAMLSLLRFVPKTSAGCSNVSSSYTRSSCPRSRPDLIYCADNESTKSLQAIAPEEISVSPTGHVLLTLDTRTRAGPGGGGRDVVVWGSNYDYQLGTGKRGSMAVPTALQSTDGERFMLQSKKAAEVRDMQGRVWKKGVEVEQKAVAGWSNSVVYWRIR